MTYRPPLDEIRFTLSQLVGYENLSALPGCDAVNAELADAVLEEAGKLAAESFAPINAKGDKQGLRFENGHVKTPDGFIDAYKHYVDGGWNGLCFPEDVGGQNLPFTLSMAVQEMLQSGNLSLALCTLLNQGACETLSELGTDAQKALYLPNMVSGNWSGTMNLTEPQAGSDVGAVRCKAWKDSTAYRVQGQKIFISYGEHDLSENIIHLVLARLPAAPPGTKGLSLFLVPKLLVDSDGNISKRNDVRCVSIEHKLGQHASPACTLAFGDEGGAYAELVGKENGGIEAMFVMMNNARLGVGIQGLGLCERATQAAAEFARTRVQSRPLNNPKGEPVTIIQHPDVRRMLLGMKAQTQAARALAYSAGLAADQAKRGKNPAAQARVDLLTPIVKAWLTDLSNEITSTAVQVFGGMGFVEETGVAQYMRDARVLAIYEGTNGIQANDLLFRKLARDEGKSFFAYTTEMQGACMKLRTCPGDDAKAIASGLSTSLAHLDQAAKHLLNAVKEDVNVAALAAVPFLRLFAVTAGGAQMARTAQMAIGLLAQGKSDFLEAKLIAARFYAESILPQTAGLLPVILSPQKGVLALNSEAF
jgi:alkylation response protein AidB-like acyl-CoA dehydrogenase